MNAKDNRGVTALMSACNYGELETARLLLDKGADANAQTEKGITALMLAAGGVTPANLKVVELLVSKGAQINLTDGLGKTAIDWAERKGRKDMKEFLLKNRR